MSLLELSCKWPLPLALSMLAHLRMCASLYCCYRAHACFPPSILCCLQSQALHGQHLRNGQVLLSTALTPHSPTSTLVPFNVHPS